MPEPDQIFERAARLCALLSVPERLRILRALYDGERSFDELLVRTGVVRTDLLPHLNTLCRSGLVTWRHRRLDVLYGVTATQLNLVAHHLARLMGHGSQPFWQGKLLPTLCVNPSLAPRPFLKQEQTGHDQSS
jgi:DNA-binding transcriptional ArsR family regulator